MAVSYFYATGAYQTWTVPNDWNPTNNKIECYGAGGDGAAYSGRSGGGGNYASISNFNLTPGSNVSIFVGTVDVYVNTIFSSTTTLMATGAALAGSVGTTILPGGASGGTDTAGAGPLGGAGGAAGVSSTNTVYH